MAEIVKLSRKERKARAEQKKEAIRKEIFDVMYKCSEEVGKNELSSVHYEFLDKAITIMIKRNPQEAHLVRTICAEIRTNPKAFCYKQLNKKKNE